MKPRTLMIDASEVTIRRAMATELIDLRHRVLRAGLPRSEAIFPGDDLPSSFHFAAIAGPSSVIGCATFHHNSWENAPAYQLRGMATDPDWAGKGIGKAVLSYAIETITSGSPVHRFWCNARLIAIPFYQRMGWKIVSDLFEIPTAGPHYRMVLMP
jgi:GNAT superfamily N-acetyltransferase